MEIYHRNGQNPTEIFLPKVFPPKYFAPKFFALNVVCDWYIGYSTFLSFMRRDGDINVNYVIDQLHEQRDVSVGASLS